MKKRNTVGLDMGDKSHTICVLDWQGQVVERFAAAFLQFFLQEGYVGCGLHEGIADGIGMLDDEVQVFFVLFRQRRQVHRRLREVQALLVLNFPAFRLGVGNLQVGPLFGQAFDDGPDFPIVDEDGLAALKVFKDFRDAARQDDISRII